MTPQRDPVLFPAFSGLYLVATTIKTDICKALSKSDFNDVVVEDMTGRGNNKISKDYIAKSVISIIKAIEGCLNPVIEDKTFYDYANNNDSVKSKPDTSIVDAVDRAIRQHSAEIDKQLTTLHDIQEMISKLSVSATNLCKPSEAFCSVSDIISPDTTNESVSHTLKPIDVTVEDFISADDQTEFLEFFSKEEFIEEGGRGVATYGEKYDYMGHKIQPKPLPDCIKKLMDTLNKTKTAGKYELNSCLVNRYEGPESSLPLHADDEYSINPESDIFTVSIGESRGISFTDIFSGEESEHIANPGSLYIMSRDSQNYFKHEIKSDSTHVGLRYSLTLRCVHWRYLNSMCIIGDSNTKKITFGVGKGTVGESTPGKQVLAYTVEEINPMCCASYKNVVIVVGTNNLRSRNVNNLNDVKSIYSMYKGKILEIKKLNKSCNIFVVPVLPTKLINVNRKVTDFNGLIFRDLSQSCDSVSFVDVSQFVDRRNGLLLESLSRSSEDALHISSAGVGILVRLIKTCIFQRKRSSKIRGSRSFSSIVSDRPDDGSH